MLRRLAIGAFLVALIPTSAHARDSRARVVVRFAPSVSKAEAARLTSAIRAQLGDAATTTLEVDTSSDCVVAVERSERGLVVHMAEDVALEAGTTRVVAHEGEVGASEVASIVRAFVLATTERAVSSTADATGDDETREAVSAVVPESMPTATLPSRAPLPSERDSVVDGAAPALGRVRLAALYTGATYAAGLPWQSGARVEGAYAFRRGYYGGLTYAVHPAAEIATESASILSSRQSGGVFVGIESEHRGWAVGTDASVGLERATRSSRPSTALTGSTTRLAPIFALRLHGRWHFPGGRGAALDFAPTFEVVPGRDRLVLDAAGSTTELVVASARFRVDVGGTFDLF